MKTNHLKLVKVYSDNNKGTIMTEAQYTEECLSMSTGDFHTHKMEVVSGKTPAKALTADRWTNEICKKKRVWKKSEINAVIKMLNSANYHNTKKDAVVYNAIKRLESVSSIGCFEHSITKEQSQFGIEYLLKRYFKKTGEARKNCPFGIREERILKSFKKFTFVGFHACYNRYGDMRWMLPVYRVYSKNGEYFNYSPVHWGTPIVHN